MPSIWPRIAVGAKTRTLLPTAMSATPGCPSDRATTAGQSIAARIVPKEYRIDRVPMTYLPSHPASEAQRSDPLGTRIIRLVAPYLSVEHRVKLRAGPACHGPPVSLNASLGGGAMLRTA